jgi:hypothetical protein
MTTDEPKTTAVPVTQRRGRKTFAQLHGERGRVLCAMLPESLFKQLNTLVPRGTRNTVVIEAMRTYIDRRAAR